MNYLIKIHHININICHFLYQTLQPFLEFLLSNKGKNNNYFIISKKEFPGESYLSFHKKMFDLVLQNISIIPLKDQMTLFSKISHYDI